jgi:DNA-binding CsgD family transcriptional regulator
MAVSSSHLLSLIDDCWRMDLTTEAWCGLLAESFGACFPNGSYPSAFLADNNPGYLQALRVFTELGEETGSLFEQTIASTPMVLRDSVRRTDGTFAFSHRDVLGGAFPDELQSIMELAGCNDVFTVGCMLNARQMFTMVVGTGARNGAGHTTTDRWRMLASHLGAAARVRAALCSPDDGGIRVDGVVDKGGRLIDTTSDELASSDARSLLDLWVKQRDESRLLAHRGHKDDALELRPALMRGDWSVMDLTDTDGKELFFVVKNPVTSGNLRTLSEMERQVLALAAGDASLKVIADQLGKSESTVSRHMSAGLARLGVNSRATWIRLSRLMDELDLNPAIRPSYFELGGTLVGQIRAPALSNELLARLTPAEASVARRLAAGETDARIAEALNIHRSTVANQTSSVFQKFNVNSRTELAALCVFPSLAQ